MRAADAHGNRTWRRLADRRRPPLRELGSDVVDPQLLLVAGQVGNRERRLELHLLRRLLLERGVLSAPLAQDTAAAAHELASVRFAFDRRCRSAVRRPGRLDGSS